MLRTCPATLRFAPVLSVLSLVLVASACTDRAPTEPPAADPPLLATTGDGGEAVLWDGTVGEDVHGSHEVITTLSAGLLCRMTTFENGGNFQEIHPENGYLIEGSGMRFPGWRTLTSGFYANNPSPPTIALLTVGSREVTFDEPVSAVSFYYASREDVTLNAFDAAGTLRATATGPRNYVQSDPIPYRVWDLLGGAVAGDIITRVTVHGSGGGTGIDDIAACREPLDASERIEFLSLQVQVIGADDREVNGLLAILDAALASVQKDRPSATAQLNAFISAVDGFINGGLLPVADGDALIAAAQNIIALLSP